LSPEALGKTCSLNVCRECKICCCQDAKPPLTRARVKAIKTYLRKNELHITNPFDHAGYSFPVLDDLGFCIFYGNTTKRCQVHAVKPETCRAGPFTFDIDSRTGKIEWFLKQTAICAFAGELRENREQLEEHFKIAKKQIMKLICHLDAESLRTILRIEEPHTFKIGEATLPDEVAQKLGGNSY